MTQFIGEYAQLPAIGIAGESVDGHDASDFIYRINAGDKNVQTVATATVAGTIGTETFVSTIVLNIPENPALTVTASTTAGGAITTATHVAADQVAKLNANIYFYRVAVASNVAGVITITVRANQYGKNPITSIANTASGSATYTAAPALTSFTLGSSVPYSFAVGQATTDSDGEARLWKGTGRILGICALFRTSEQAYDPTANSLTGVSLVSPADAIAAGGQLKIKRKGRIYVLAADAVTRNAAVYANNTTGQIQASSSGATAITGATFEGATTAANQIVAVQL
jgi:hypothetical protein